MNKKHPPYHFIGIGGIGMSALARICLEQECRVTGSDLCLTPNTEKLIHKGAKVNIGHSPGALPKGATVVYSSGIAETNPELLAAKKQNYPLLHRSDLLAKLMRGAKGLAVAGTHGKTTVSALLISVLIEAKCSPTFAFGGLLVEEKCNGRAGNGEYFVAEADESDQTFLKYHPYGAILTNIDQEHLDTYGSHQALLGAFSTFAGQVNSKDHLFYCADDPHLPSLIGDGGTSYGFSEGSSCCITHFAQKGWGIGFDLTFEGRLYKEICLPLLGAFNAQNGAAVFAFALRLGIEEEVIRRAFASFQGISRRLEKKGEKNSILVVDDYAHHPTEIKKTLAALKKAVPSRRLVAIFQPHRPSRTKELFDQYITAFNGADLLVVTDVYQADEEPIVGIDGLTLAQSIPGIYLPRSHLARHLLKMLRPHDVVVTLGAGDITEVASKLFSSLEKDSIKKFEVAVIEGGRSEEHEISLRSAKRIKQGLNPSYYTQKLFVIDREGTWHFNGEKGDPLSANILQALKEVDVVFPVLHGPFGEDGTLQGFLEILDKPYVGPDFRSAAICMDKALSKIIVQEAGVPTLPFIAFEKPTWENQQTEIIEQIGQKVGYPCYVKPVHLGSSVGIHQAENNQELIEAVRAAFSLDTKIVVEKECAGCRELEFAVIGNGCDTVEVPIPGEVFSAEIPYDYAGKYGDNPSKKEVIATLHPATLAKGRELAKRAYLALGCTGMTRVDFFLDSKGQFWFLEANPIPGMAEKSLFPRIWENKLGSSEKLMDKLICFALDRQRKRSLVS